MASTPLLLIDLSFFTALRAVPSAALGPPGPAVSHETFTHFLASGLHCRAVYRSHQFVFASGALC